METRTIIIGAGPVGLYLAGEIRLGGGDVTVYDKLPEPSGESRALGFTKRVAELFDQRGLLSRLGNIRWGQRGHFGGIGIDLEFLDEDHHGVLGLPQSATEQMLTDWLGELGVPILRGHELIGLTQDDDHVEALFDGPDGHHRVRAAHLVGCDGGHSTVRGLAGITTTGWESTRGMYMADVTGVDPRPRPTGQYVPDANMVLSVSLGDGYHRVLMHDSSLPPHPDATTLTYTDIATTWQRLTGEDIHHGTARWMSAFPNGAALADRYRSGRVLLAGDAAHDTPPLAGWGVSTGLQDAANLGWKLAAVTTGAAPDSLLDTYHDERHPQGRQLMRNTHAATMLYLSGPELDPLRALVRELVTDQAAAEHLAGQVSGLGVRYPADTGTGTDAGTDAGAPDADPVGLRLDPARELQHPDGTRTRVAELLHPARGLLIVPDNTATDTATSADAWSGRVDVVTGTWSGPAAPPAAVLVRPDGHLAWTSHSATDLTEALGRWFGPARTPTTV
ncbi:FAD-dependent monooxygenase [Streptomyces sp. NPDC088785]|uniref:FAD-dependent monooxygenase n=1 Tax=Streptomyces sp. NPDC088785 TaxID=3365897 RepID=UPI0037F9CAFD